YFALVAGKRQAPQLCTTNLEVIRLSAERALAAFREQPGRQMFSLSPEDVEGFCECERCRALDRELRANPGVLTDRLVAFWNSIRKDIPYYRSAGVDGFCSETQQNWGTQGINFYVAARLLWNPDEDVDRLLREFYRDFYGPASAPMRRYWERWEQAMASFGAQSCGGYDWWAIFTPERLAAAAGDL